MPVQVCQELVASIVWISVLGKRLPDSRESLNNNVFWVIWCKQRADEANPEDVLKVVGVVDAVGEVPGMTEETEATDIGKFVIEDVSEWCDEVSEAVDAVADGAVSKNLRKWTKLVINN